MIYMVKLIKTTERGFRTLVTTLTKENGRRFN